MFCMGINTKYFWFSYSGNFKDIFPLYDGRLSFVTCSSTFKQEPVGCFLILCYLFVKYKQKMSICYYRQVKLGYREGDSNY